MATLVLSRIPSRGSHTRARTPACAPLRLSIHAFSATSSLDVERKGDGNGAARREAGGKRRAASETDDEEGAAATDE